MAPRESKAPARGLEFCEQWLCLDELPLGILHVAGEGGDMRGGSSCLPLQIALVEVGMFCNLERRRDKGRGTSWLQQNVEFYGDALQVAVVHPALGAETLVSFEDGLPVIEEISECPLQVWRTFGGILPCLDEFGIDKCLPHQIAIPGVNIFQLPQDVSEGLLKSTSAHSAAGERIKLGSHWLPFAKNRIATHEVGFVMTPCIIIGEADDLDVLLFQIGNEGQTIGIFDCQFVALVAECSADGLIQD